jgi:hypothetical protein
MLATCTWPELDAADGVLVIPVDATELVLVELGRSASHTFRRGQSTWQ